tara:strand:+ start:839 stop:1093 length:255 start_codon:yes stop_codon:yes gene_type:complete
MFADTNRQLRKLSIRKMQFQVTQIEFDFTDDTEDFELPPIQQMEIINEVKSTIWDACDEDDLVEEITCATGWCIQSIDYVHVLK